MFLRSSKVQSYSWHDLMPRTKANLNFEIGTSKTFMTVQRMQLGPPEVFLPITRRVQNKRIRVAVAFGPITTGVKFN